MSTLLPAASSVSEAWLLSIEAAAQASGGRSVHVVSTIIQPALEVPEVRNVLDEALAKRGSQSVQTVAETIFPTSLYPDPGFDWVPGIPTDQVAVLDAAAEAMYGAYLDALPLLLTANGNRLGTYFARMISWPGKASGGVNQLQARIERLRSEHSAGRQTHNALDMDIAADALEDDDPVPGLQVYAATDRRIRAFPCLTHVDLTLHEGRLHCLAVYRHQYMIDKAYGNMLGLSWLMQFLCQQSGYDVGELVVHATLADAEKRLLATSVAADARAALDASNLSGAPA